jgi:outer membrane receptor protein involved in Fe transport
MTTCLPVRPRAVFASRAALAAFIALMASAAAQTAPTVTAPPKNSAPPKAVPTPAETVQLSAFEVKADADNSYGALESNSLTAFRMDLSKAPATAQVFTQAFMEDIAADSLEQVLTGYAGTVTAASNNPNASLFAPGDRDGSQGLSIRGVSAGEIKRDSFIGVPNNARTASGNTDNFSIERAEVIEGPQSLLYGSVGGGGVINSVSKRANFRQSRTSLKFVLDNYGSKRAILDSNYGRDRVAARVALLGAENATNRYKLGGELYGIYAQVAFRVLPNTTVRFSTEKTDNDAIVGFKPNLNNFLATTDPRRNLDARYLALTGQVSDIKVYGEPLTYGNLESAASWWSGERISTHWNNMIVETKLGAGFSAQLVAVYTETLDDRVTDGRNLLPGRGSTLPNGAVNPNFGANPFDVTAVAIGAPVQINEQRDRNKGARLAFVHEKDFSFWKLRGRSQTAFGGQAFHRGPTFGSSGIALVYYQADADWNVTYTQPNGTKGTTPNYALSDYGRTPLQNIYFPVQNGIPSKPLFRPGARRVTYNGVNYVLEPRITADETRITPANPFGLIPNNNPAQNTYTGNWNRGGETHSGNVYFANFTDWMDGRLTTLMGYSVTRFETMNVGAGLGNVSLTPKANHAGWQAGLNFRVLSWLRAYAVTGTAEQAESSTSDILGVPLKNPQAKNATPEFGLKATLLDGRIIAQFNYNPTTKTLNENKDAGTAFRDAINPDGVNGRVGGTNANQRVNIDRTLESQQLVLSATPTRNWTVRLSATRMGGEITSDVSYQQNYNDQFYLSNGTVTYKDGTPVRVNAAGSLAATAAKDTNLTLAMINTPTNPYYANPDPTSGRIQSTTLRTVLTTVDPAKGTAATGVTGLPISSVQYNFASPYTGGTVVIYRAGEKNVGFNELTFNFQNKYTFNAGRLKGFGIFTDVQTYAKNRAYYTNYPDATGSTAATRVVRELYRLPRATVFNVGLSYSHRGLPWLGEKYSWSTQLNVRNALNHSKVWVVPTSNLGTTLNARLSALPRSFVWTNSVYF